jgi:hypothetical protein
MVDDRDQVFTENELPFLNTRREEIFFIIELST